ncbi:hypothetical protein K503DRAFT_105855 [Rhizopogon vinicolor AM-OR11-026]|uniref:Uncharacterized protein n=1 Tax=Rhizopogon vinicolor AM-OR11-026 TaxID=1314800 RepID=A0A1B7N2V0_9AGAM|nr:hypothetical protein K503DRAFT_105855 [Rhizopogon vinicolor AM-OR11-026]
MTHPLTRNNSKTIMCSLSPLSNPLQPIISGPSLQRLNHHSSTRSHVKWSTPLTHIRVIPARETESASAEANVPSSQHGDVGPIAGVMDGLDLTPTAFDASGASTKPLQVVHQPESTRHPSPRTSSPHPLSFGAIQAAIPQIHSSMANPSLRFILAGHYKAHGPQKTSVVTDKNFVDMMTSEFTFGMLLLPMISHDTNIHIVEPNTVSGPVNETPPITTLESNDTPSSTIDLTLDSDEMNQLQKNPLSNQKSRARKDRNVSIQLIVYLRMVLITDAIQTPTPPSDWNVKVDATKRRSIEIESSDSDRYSDGPRKRRKGNSHASTNGIKQHTRAVVLEGPRSIAHAFNDVIAGKQAEIHAKPAPAPPRERQSTNTDIGVPHAVRGREVLAGTSSAVATSSKVRVEEMEDAKDEEDMDDEDEQDDEEGLVIETSDSLQAHNHASMVSRKVRWWADKLKEIRDTLLESLFEEQTVRDLSFLNVIDES